MNKLSFNSYTHCYDNGLKLITVKRATQLVSINAGIKVGAMYESTDEKGISHLIEHMLFKGTIKRSNEELNEELEFLGGDYNAYTDYNCTVYGITALEEELEKSLELLSDMLINSSFNSEELRKEKKVIAAEIKASKDDIEDLSFKKVQSAAFAESPLRYDVAGTETSVQRLSRKRILDFYKKYYVPNNCVISIVSPYNHEEVISKVEKYFSTWKEKEVSKYKGTVEKNKNVIRTSFKQDIEQSTVTYLYTFNDLPKDMELPLKILNLKLGESSNSILFRELREKRGLAYDIYTFLDMSMNVKSLYIYTAVSRENIRETIEAIEESIRRIINKEIVFNKKTVELMKKVHKTAVLSTLEDPKELGSYILHQNLEDEDIYEFISEMEKLQKLKGEDIHKVANIVLREPTIHVLKSQ